MSLIHDLEDINTNSSSLRPQMHLAKAFSPVVAARLSRTRLNLHCDPMETLIKQVETSIDKLMEGTGIELPGEPWQRACIRSAIIDLAAQDIREQGSVEGTWLDDFLELMRAAPLTFGQGVSVPETSIRTRTAKTNSITRLLTSLNDFAFLHDPKKLAKKLADILVADTRSFAESIGGGSEDTDQGASLFANLLSNHTNLMISAIDAESQRIGVLSPSDLKDYSAGLPLDGLMDTYKASRNELQKIVTQLESKDGMGNNGTCENKPAASFITPSFMR